MSIIKLLAEKRKLDEKFVALNFLIYDILKSKSSKISRVYLTAEGYLELTFKEKNYTIKIGEDFKENVPEELYAILVHTLFLVEKED